MNGKDVQYLLVASITMYVFLVSMFSVIAGELIFWNQYFLGCYVGIVVVFLIYVVLRNRKTKAGRN